MSLKDYPEAPGCFGHAITYNPEDAVCMACAVAAECSVQSFEKLLKLRKLMGIDGDSAPPIPATPAPAETVPSTPAPPTPVVKKAVTASAVVISVVGMSKKADQVYQSLKSKGIDFESEVKTMMLSASVPTWLRLLVIHLHGGPQTRGELADALIKDLAWGEKTARSHVSIFVSLAGALNLLVEDGSKRLSFAP